MQLYGSLSEQFENKFSRFMKKILYGLLFVNVISFFEFDSFEIEMYKFPDPFLLKYI